MNKEELALYETPAIAGYISNSFLQSVVARYIAWKVNTKIDRMNKRQKRAVYLKSKGLLTNNL